MHVHYALMDTYLALSAREALRGYSQHLCDLKCGYLPNDADIANPSID
jgi:hypothetical protein